MSITYNSTSISSGNYRIRRLDHENSPDNVLNSLQPARQDGVVVISDNYGIKNIRIVGMVVGTSNTDLETNIDTLKALVALKDKNLDISYAGGTRRYVCRLKNIIIDRDFYNLNYAPFVINFEVPSGIGLNTSSTNILNLTGATAVTATTSTQALTFAGSYNPKPVHKITINTRGNADVIRVENTDTGDYMDVDLDGIYTSSNYIEIDEENQTVKYNGSTNMTYRGKFPSVSVGANNLKLTIFGSGSTEDFNIDTAGSDYANFVNSGWTTAPRAAQSFVPNQSGRIYKIVPTIRRVQNGGLGGTLKFYIMEDNNGIPGSGILFSGYYSIAYADVPDTIFDDIDAMYSGDDIDRPFLVKGNRYWIYLLPSSISGGSSSNYYQWSTNNAPATYLNGKAVFIKTSSAAPIDGYADASAAAGGVPGQYDMAVALYMGGDGGAASHSVDWKIDYVKKYI